MKIKIVVQDNTKVEEAEKYGFEAEPEFDYTDWYFHARDIRSMWVDQSRDEWEIVLGYDGAEYRTAYSDDVFNKLKKMFDEP